MNTPYRAIYICHYNFTESECQWLLTGDRIYAASIDSKFQLASITDLLDWVAATGKTFNGILSVKEGLCNWIEREYADEFGEMNFDYGYVLI
ncbi:hypothetical protein [Brevibacillus sp. NRS-1366]|uniref:hypothetical protein n=1 Tax=Brevibacillus sp. NRS-1366 TaxID=3233899 RepID=UPI003D1E18FE